MNRGRQMADETSLRYEGWRVAMASGVGVFVSFASLLVYTFSIFLKPLAEEFSWSREAVSGAFGIAAMTVAVCSPPLGFLLDRISPRRIIIPCRRKLVRATARRWRSSWPAVPSARWLLPPATEALIRLVGWRGACVVLGALVLTVGVPTVARFIRRLGRAL